MELSPEALREMSNVELVKVGVQVFDKSDLVDMKQVFGYMVDQLKDRRIVDNHTRNDIMLDIISYFTKYSMPFQGKIGNSNDFIYETDIARYFANHLNENDSLQQILKISSQIHGADIFQSAIVNSLQGYIAQNRALPSSFGVESIREEYLKMKTGFKQNAESVKINEKTMEIFLLSFNQH